MKKILWIGFIILAYVWTISTGREQFVVDQSKRLYQSIAAWFEDAKIDYQAQSQPIVIPKKKHRRWD